MALRHESGVHVRCLLKNELAYAAYPPSAIGQGDHSYALGKHSGAAGVKAFFAAHGIHLPFAMVKQMNEAVRREARRLKRDLAEHEVLELYAPKLEEAYREREPKAG